MNIIVKNNTEQDIQLTDLFGTIIPASGQKTLSDAFSRNYISKSDDLKINVQSENVTINDGTDDLSISDGLKLIDFGSQYNIEIVNTIASNIKPFFILSYYSNSSNVKNMYVYTGSDASNKTGFIVPKNGKVISISYMNYYPNTSQDSGYISIRKNETYTEIAKLDIVEGSQKQYTTSPSGSLEFSAGDWLSCYVSGGKLTKPVINIEITWI